MISKKLRIGLIGYGNWGKRIYETLHAFPEVEISIVEKNVFARFCDAVIIATPSSTHAELALRYIDKDIPVFVEKPLATSAADVERITRHAKANNAIVFVGYIYLYNNFIDHIKDNYKKALPIRSINFVGYNQRSRKDTSLLWDWLPHDLSICHKLFGAMPSYVTGKAKRVAGIIESATLEFEHKGITIISKISCREDARRLISIDGENGVITCDDRLKHLEITLKRQKFIFSSDDYIPPLRTELQKFIEIIQNRHDTKYLNSSHDLDLSLKIADVIETAEKHLIEN